MNLLRRFGTVRGHPFATDRHPLTGISHPIHQRLNGHGGVHHPDEGEGGVAVDTGVGQGRCVTAVMGGAGSGRRNRGRRCPRPCGCPRRFRQKDSLKNPFFSI